MKIQHLVALVALCSFVEAARILVVVPTPSISHQVVFRPLTQELVKRGHEVVIITTDPAFPKGEAPVNLTEIDLHDFSYKAWREVVFSSRTTGNPTDSFEQIKMIMPLLSKIFELQMQTEEVKYVINNNTNHFDLLIIEAAVVPALGLTHIFEAPVIAMSSLAGFGDHYDTFGAPSRPALLYPTPLRQRLDNLTLKEKITELYNHYRFLNFFESSKGEWNKLIKKLFGPDVPDVSELYKNLDMLFLNVHPIWEFNRPVPPNIIYMGGLHQKISKELPKDLKEFLDSSQNGVIYISYGTNVSPSLLPPEKIQTLVQAFSELPYDVLWKWDKDELPNQPPNIRISKWLPQSDLLKHPKIKVFITQGGLQSTDEAITAGVPLIGMPMLGDQWYNVEMYIHHKVGVRLDMADVTKEKFKDTINTVINDGSVFLTTQPVPTEDADYYQAISIMLSLGRVEIVADFFVYRKNMERLRAIMSDQPQKPLERAVWWTEYLLRHGGASHMRALTANMSWSEYLDVELLTAIAVFVLFVIAVMIFAANLIYGFVRQVVLGSNKLKKS